MMGKIRKRILNLIKNPLFFLIMFSFLNGILLFKITNLAPPDFYKYCFAAEKLFAGNLKLKFIPPLFPVFLWILGSFINLLFSNYDGFIIGAKLISFLSSVGIVFFSYKLFKETTENFYSIGVIFILSSPFLQFFVFPTTDSLYLFFVVLSFYFFLTEKNVASFVSSLLGVFTRFEGILLFFSYIVNFIRIKKKIWVKYLMFILIISGGLLVFYIKLVPRLISKIQYIFDSKSYLYFIKNPLQLFSIIYSAILFFIPAKLPLFIHWGFLFILIILFAVGFYYLYKKNKRFAISVLLYECIFFIAKGYIFTVHRFSLSSSHHIRRFLSFIYLFYFVSFVGLFYGLKVLKEKLKGKSFFYLRIILYLFVLYICFVKLIIVPSIILISIVFIAPIIYLFIKDYRIHIFEKAIFFILFFVFFMNIYLISYKKAYKYNLLSPNRGAYVIAKWLNNNHIKPGDRIAVFSTLTTVRYYLNKKVNIIYFIPKTKSIYDNYNKLVNFFLKKIIKYKIKYIIFDGYMNPIDRPGEVALKRMLFKESKKGRYFKIKKQLIYKNQYVATILKFRKF